MNNLNINLTYIQQEYAVNDKWCSLAKNDALRTLLAAAVIKHAMRSMAPTGAAIAQCVSDIRRMWLYIDCGTFIISRVKSGNWCLFNGKIKQHGTLYQSPSEKEAVAGAEDAVDSSAVWILHVDLNGRHPINGSMHASLVQPSLLWQLTWQ
jgi:hypothetical protein